MISFSFYDELLLHMVVVCVHFKCTMCSEKEVVGFQDIFDIYLRYLASRFHRLCGKWACIPEFNVYFIV